VILADPDRKQLLNNLRASRLDLGLLPHFGPTPSFKRIYIESDGNRSLDIIG
jgi:hypothetical protein